MKKKILIFVTIIIFLYYCQSKNEDIVKYPDRDGSVETELSIEKHQNYDVLITKHLIWKDNRLEKKIEKKDTIPSLGIINETAEDSEGNQKNVEIEKDYEFYITIK